MKTYTAQVGPDNAARLAIIGAQTDGEPIMDDIGEGTVKIGNLELLRTRAAGDDASITDDEDGLQIWIGGESYPIFDDLDSAVAEAVVAQNRYAEAEHDLARFAAQRVAAVARVVELTGSPTSAAELLSLDEPAVAALLATAESSVPPAGP